MDKYTPEQARRLRGISQAKMASLLGMSENTYIIHKISCLGSFF